MQCLKKKKDRLVQWVCVLVGVLLLGGCAREDIPDVDDGSAWIQVNAAGFGSTANYSVSAMAEYNGFLYAMTRNEEAGAEIWRYDGTAWQQVLFADNETNGIYGNPWINNLWGDMVVFQGKLYCAFSSGVQGYVLKSTGCEIWRFDGSTWEPVISDRVDIDEEGAITAIAGCEDADGDPTAAITDSSKEWETDMWAGGVLQITSGSGMYRTFLIVSNTADTLTVQQQEVVGDADAEFTICGSQDFENPFPPYEYTVGSVSVGDHYEIGLGTDESGFGDMWNKTIPDMVLHEDRLYVGTGLNFVNGAQVWYTEDGDTWQVTEPVNSLGLYHDDPDFNQGKKPVVTSISGMTVSTVSGEPTLYIGGAGSSGNLGSCARMAMLTDAGWQLLVDQGVDVDDEGTNENGFGSGMNCSMFNGNFIPWSLVEFDSYLYVGVQSLAGARVLFTGNAAAEDGSWLYSVGGDAEVPAGFDGKRNLGSLMMHQNIAVNLMPFNNELYAGLVSVYAPTVGATQQYLTGAQLWKTSDGVVWQRYTADGFGDRNVIAFEAFSTYNGALYVAGNKGCVDCPYGLEPPEGVKIFKLVPGS